MAPHVTDTRSPSVVCEVFIDGRKADIGSITLARDGFDPLAPFDVSIKAQITPETPWAREQRKRQELIDFAKTGAPPALVAEGNVSDSAWIDNSPTYSAVEASRDRVAAMASAKGAQAESESFERCVPRRFEQKPWIDPTKENGTADIGAMRAGTNFEPGCCHRTVLKRCDGCPYDAPKKAKRPESLNDFAAECHRDNQHWWHDPATGAKLDRNMGEMLMLVVSEIAECMEGERKNLMDDHLPHRRMAEVELADAIIRIMDIAGAKRVDLDHHVMSTSSDSKERDWIPRNKGEALFHIVKPLQELYRYDGWQFARKLARTVVRISRYANHYGYDLWGAVAEKREYNKHRADHKPEARLAANGKKF